MKEVTTIRIDIAVTAIYLEEIANWCIENEINYSMSFGSLETFITVNSDSATLIKLKFPI